METLWTTSSNVCNNKQRSHDRLRTGHIFNNAGGIPPCLTFEVAAHYKPNSQDFFNSVNYSTDSILSWFEILYLQYLLLFTPLFQDLSSRMVAIHCTVSIKTPPATNVLLSFAFLNLHPLPLVCWVKGKAVGKSQFYIWVIQGKQNMPWPYLYVFDVWSPLPTCHWAHMSA